LFFGALARHAALKIEGRNEARKHLVQELFRSNAMQTITIHFLSRLLIALSAWAA